MINITPLNPLVSILIPTYEQKEYIARAVQSAFDQTYRPIEILVCDDSQLQDYTDVIDKFKDFKELSYYKNPIRLGLAGNYRNALSKSKGDWIINLDGDDYFINNRFIEKCIQAISGRDNVVFVSGGQVVHYLKDDRTIEQYPTDKSIEYVDGLDFFYDWLSYKRRIVPHLATLYNSQLSKAIGFYSEDIIPTDWESLRKLSAHGTVALIREVSGVWNIHGTNSSSTIDPIKLANGIKSVVNPYVYVKNRFKNCNEIKLHESYIHGVSYYDQMIFGRCLSLGGTFSLFRSYYTKRQFLLSEPEIFDSLSIFFLKNPLFAILLIVNRFTPRVFYNLSKRFFIFIKSNTYN